MAERYGQMTKEELLKDLSERLPEDADIQFATVTYIDSGFKIHHYDTEVWSITE